MLKYILTDINSVETVMNNPFSMSIVSSDDAPADSFKAVFVVSGRIPEIYSVKVLSGAEVIFLGYVDEQTETVAENGVLLEIKARSLAAVLLDSEAMPQTYCMPSLRLLFERHFRPLGIKGYEGTDSAIPGELGVSKGMNEWQVLENFCDKFLGTKPYITNDGIIHTGENRQCDTVFLSGDNPKMRVSRTLRRKALISDIYARTHISGGYEMHFVNEKADKHMVNRCRYVNTVDSKHRSILYIDDIISAANHKYESYIFDIGGIVICRVGDTLRLDGTNKNMKIKELHYVLDSKGEQTRIYAEVTD